MERPKKIVFLTGTRADFGKLKPLMKKIERSKMRCFVFVTGMHTLSKYGSTFHEVEKEKFKNIYVYMNQTEETPMEIILANTARGFSDYVKEIKPDMIVVHGDRVEALAGAIVGSFNNILTAHIEGGEISGTIDELIRHSITKLSHIHFVSNTQAKKRLIQMGEEEKTVFVIGSPDIDIMKGNDLPEIEETKKRFEFPFGEYAVFVFHPVTTELQNLKKDIKEIVSALKESGQDYLVIYPNNDPGSHFIMNEYKKLKKDKHFKIYPSIRFEYFLCFLKNSRFIIGNSSAGIREAEVFGVPAINIGARQAGRSKNKDILNVGSNKNEILRAIKKAEKMKIKPKQFFGDGKSAERFYSIFSGGAIWKTKIQKQFKDSL